MVAARINRERQRSRTILEQLHSRDGQLEGFVAKQLLASVDCKDLSGSDSHKDSSLKEHKSQKVESSADQ